MSSNYTRVHLKSLYGANSSLKMQNLSLNDMNLSLNSSTVNMSTETKKVAKYLPNPRHIKNDVTGVITHFLVKQAVATNDSSGYYIDLSKNVSGQASRYLLAFFVPDNSAASQAVAMPSSTAPKVHLSATRGHSLIHIANHLLTNYDGLTLQNTIAERRICRAVTNVTESKTRHLILLPYIVAFTQKTLGDIHHG